MKHRRTRAMITVSFCMKSIRHVVCIGCRYKVSEAHAPILHFREVPVRNEGFVTYIHLVVDDTIQIGSTGYNVIQDCLRNLVNLRFRHIRDRKDETALWVNSHEPTVLALRGLAIFARSTGTGWWNSRTLCRDFLMTVHRKRVVDVNVEETASCGLCGLGPHLVAFQNYRVVELRAGIFTIPSIMLFCIFPKCLRLRELDGIVADASTELKGVVVVQKGTFESHLVC